jgi:hypothetical protein
MLCYIMLIAVMFSYVVSIIVLGVVTLSMVMLSARVQIVVLPSVIMLSAGAPTRSLIKNRN